MGVVSSLVTLMEEITLLKVSHDGMSFEITKLMLNPVNNLCFLIKLLSLFPACVIYSPFVALSIFVVLSNFCRIIKLLPSWGFELFFLGIYIRLVISQDIPSCETFGREIVALHKISHRKCDCFFAFAKLPNRWLFGIPLPKI